MITAFRGLLFLLVGLTVSGCNLVYSERPLFRETDARSAAPLREGLWLRPDKDCVVDPAAPPKDMPECANVMVVKGGIMRPLDKPGAADAGPPPDIMGEITYLLAGGDPRIMQNGLTLKGKKKIWIYNALEPVRTDAEGRIVAARLWNVLCGPPPPKEPGPDGKVRHVTEHPLPGLTVRESNCLARRADVVRNAARHSREWDDDKAEIRWLTDTVE